MLNKIYEATKLEIDRSLDVIYDIINDALLEGKFDDVNSVLINIDIRKLNDTQLLGMLSITYAAHHRLPYRAEFFKKCYREFQNRNIEDVEGLVRGLKENSTFLNFRKELFGTNANDDF